MACRIALVVLGLAAGCATRGDDRFPRLPDAPPPDARVIVDDARPDGPDGTPPDAALDAAPPDAAAP